MDVSLKAKTRRGDEKGGAQRDKRGVLRARRGWVWKAPKQIDILTNGFTSIIASYFLLLFPVCLCLCLYRKFVVFLNGESCICLGLAMVWWSMHRHGNWENSGLNLGGSINFKFSTLILFVT